MVEAVIRKPYTRTLKDGCGRTLIVRDFHLKGRRQDSVPGILRPVGSPFQGGVLPDHEGPGPWSLPVDFAVMRFS
ncbi:hypothetical protein GCM10010841_27390 [Deinococcus aerophilus]|uniref:Transposase n=1 Tax=Deinococcus aerophilus TaxID=522488 RepID=A0ABQ2GY01_9DEIO|nr:hypothetical protein GCM10010841_27390 [Deinococcus aerophilus]